LSARRLGYRIALALRAAARPLAIVVGGAGLLWSVAQWHPAAAVALFSAALLAVARRRA